jgi:hypothetical protein
MNSFDQCLHPWKQTLQRITAVSALAFMSSAALAQAATYEQLPGHFGGFSSDGATITVADEFVLTEKVKLRSLT